LLKPELKKPIKQVDFQNVKRRSSFMTN